MQKSFGMLKNLCCRPVRLVKEKPFRKELAKAIAPFMSVFVFLVANIFIMCSILHANGMFFHILDTAYERAWEMGTTMELNYDSKTE